MSIKSKQLHLNRKFDQIRQMEESGELKNKKSGNRALRKLLNNRLAIVGGVIFLIILLACIFAPLLTGYSPKAVDMKSILKPPSGEHWFGTDKIAGMYLRESCTAAACPSRLDSEAPWAVRLSAYS